MPIHNKYCLKILKSLVNRICQADRFNINYIHFISDFSQEQNKHTKRQQSRMNKHK